MNNPVCQHCGQESGNERRVLDKVALLMASKKRDKKTIRKLREQRKKDSATIRTLEDSLEAARTSAGALRRLAAGAVLLPGPPAGRAL